MGKLEWWGYLMVKKLCGYVSKQATLFAKIMKKYKYTVES